MYGELIKVYRRRGGLHHGGGGGGASGGSGYSICCVSYSCSCGTTHQLNIPTGTPHIVYTCHQCGCAINLMADYGSGSNWNYQTPKTGRNVHFSDEEMAASDVNMGNTWEVEYQSAAGFKKCLMEAIERAKDHDLTKLKAMYPNTVVLYENTAGDFKHGVNF